MSQDKELPLDPPSLSRLFSRYLAGRTASGLVPEQDADVVLHDAGPVQPIDPRSAWDEAVAVLKFAPVSEPAGPSTAPDWRGLTAAQEPALDLAFCAGNFPQMVRNLTLLLQTEAEGKPGPKPHPFVSTSLNNWADQCAAKAMPQVLIAAGVLRLARDFERAERLLKGRSPSMQWNSAHANELASLAWHRGRRDEALRLWDDITDHIPALFNRGMANLFLGRPAQAVAPLKKAAAALPESGSWHHLGRLYLTLAEMRQ